MTEYDKTVKQLEKLAKKLDASYQLDLKPNGPKTEAFNELETYLKSK